MVMYLLSYISCFSDHQLKFIRNEKDETFAFNSPCLSLIYVFPWNECLSATFCTMSWLILKFKVPILLTLEFPLLACSWPLLV